MTRPGPSPFARFARASSMAWPLLVALACRDKVAHTDAPPPPLDVTHDPTTVYDVTYTDSTVIVDVPAFKQALVSATSDGHVLVVNPVAEFQKLQPGSVLLVKGVGIKKVLAVMPFQDKIALLVTEGEITDAIQHGHIHVEHDVGFDASAMAPSQWSADAPHFGLAGMGGVDPLFALFQGGQPAPSGVQAKVHDLAQKKVDDLWKQVSEGSDSANGGLGGCGKVSDWDYCVHGNRGASRINLRASLAKNVYGFIGTIKADGYLDNFSMATDLEVDDRKISSFQWDTRNANGLINLQLIAAKNNPVPISKQDIAESIPLPGSFSMTYLVGPLPLTIKVSEALLVHPGFTGVNQILEANFRMTYNSTQHLSVHEGNIDDHGNVTGLTESLGTHTMLTGPYAFLVAMAGPRIEVGFDADVIWGSLTALVPEKLATLAANAFLEWQPVKDALNGPYAPEIQEALGLIKTVAGAALKSKAAVHLDFIMSVGVLSTGEVTMIPCQKTTETMSVQVGANASLFGTDVKDSLKKVLFHHTWEQGTVSGPCAIDQSAPS